MIHHQLVAAFAEVFCQHFRQEFGQQGFIEENRTATNDVPRVLEASEHLTEGVGKEVGLFLSASLNEISILRARPIRARPTQYFRMERIRLS